MIFRLTIFVMLSAITADCYSQMRQDKYFYDSFVCVPQNHNSPMTDSSRIRLRIQNYLNPAKAAGLAIVPGFILRGAGHWYAQKYLLSTGLFITAVIGFKLYFGANDNVGEGIPISEENKHYKLEKYSGLILLCGTWAYDMIAAPIVCIRHNKRIKENLSIKPFFAKNQWGSRIGIQLSCNF